MTKTTYYGALVLLVLFATAAKVVWADDRGQGFSLRGPVTFQGFQAGEPVWGIGKAMHFIVQPPLHKHFLALEGEEITVTITRARK